MHADSLHSSYSRGYLYVYSRLQLLILSSEINVMSTTTFLGNDLSFLPHIISPQLTPSQLMVLFLLEYQVSYMSLVVRKPVFGVSDQVRHKLGCTITEDV